MTPTLALVVWFVVLILIFLIFWYFIGYGTWLSFIMAVLIALIALIILYPWNFEHRYMDAHECKNWIDSLFGLIVIISLVILIIYIIGTYL